MYTVTWDIDIEADSPREAAEEAQRIMQDPESTAQYFKVEYMLNKHVEFKSQAIYVDLLEEE